MSPVPAVNTAAYNRWRKGGKKAIRAVLRPAPADRDEVVLTIWRTRLFDTYEIALRTGLDEHVVDHIISADMEERHG